MERKMKSFEERKRNSKSDLYEQQFFDGIMKKGFSIIDNRSNMNLPDFTIFYDNSKKIC